MLNVKVKSKDFVHQVERMLLEEKERLEFIEIEKNVLNKKEYVAKQNIFILQEQLMSVI